MKLIRRVREAEGLTQAQLAARLGVSQPSVARLEKAGDTVTLATLRRTLEAMGHTLEIRGPRAPATQLRGTPGERIERHGRGLVELLRALDGVEHVVTGGVAAVAHGSARLTHDLDVVHAGDDANLERLSEALRKLHARVRELDGAQVLRLATDHGDLDLVTSPDYARLRANAIDATVGGVTVKVAGPGDLRRS